MQVNFIGIKLGELQGGGKYIKYDNMLSMPTLWWIRGASPGGSAPLIHHKVGSFAYYPIHKHDITAQVQGSTPSKLQTD